MPVPPPAFPLAPPMVASATSFSSSAVAITTRTCASWPAWPACSFGPASSTGFGPAKLFKNRIGPSSKPNMTCSTRNAMASLAGLRLDRLPLLVTARGETIPHDAVASLPAALLPGSFDPAHHGHWSLAASAQRHLNMPVAFEISIANVDKPELTADEVHKRVAQFRE